MPQCMSFPSIQKNFEAYRTRLHTLYSENLVGVSGLSRISWTVLRQSSACWAVSEQGISGASSISAFSFSGRLNTIVGFLANMRWFGFRRYDKDQGWEVCILSLLAQEGCEFIRTMAKLIVLSSQLSASSSSNGSFGEIAPL